MRNSDCPGLALPAPLGRGRRDWRARGRALRPAGPRLHLGGRRTSLARRRGLALRRPVPTGPCSMHGRRRALWTGGGSTLGVAGEAGRSPPATDPPIEIGAAMHSTGPTGGGERAQAGADGQAEAKLSKPLPTRPGHEEQAVPAGRLAPRGATGATSRDAELPCQDRLAPSAPAARRGLRRGSLARCTPHWGRQGRTQALPPTQPGASCPESPRGCPTRLCWREERAPSTQSRPRPGGHS